MARWLIILILVSGISCTSPEKKPFRIAAAANVQFACKELIETFESASGFQCELVIASSGKLTTQISHGAPYDVFLSADARYPKTLVENGHAEGPPVTYAIGRLVLWTAGNMNLPSLDVIANEAVKHLALANPATAPYGTAAEEVLKNLGLLEQVKDRLVFGESVSQTTQFIQTETATLGFTALSIVRSPQFPGTGSWLLVPDSLHAPIEQQMVITSHDPDQRQVARDFVSFMQSDEAKAILKSYGYETP